jgi:hypothetical protein
VAFASAGSLAVVGPVGSDRLNTVCEPWASVSLTVSPESLATDRSTIVWPPIATLGGVSASPAPIFSLTTKCGVGLGGWVWVWLVLALELVELELELVVLAAGGAAVELLEVLDVAALVADVAGAADEREDAAAATVELDVEWLLEPHAATSSAGASAKPNRFSIGSG